MRKSILSAAAIACAATAGVTTAASAADDSLTLAGITIYGTIDLGVAYQTHGTPLSSDFYPGLEYLISKNSNHSLFSLAPNGLSQSKLGIKGTEELIDGFSGVFKLEMAFEPQSGTIGDSSKSLVANNGVALANQTSNADGSRNGQPFAQQAYFGVTSKKYGTLTMGRQYTLLQDDVLAYDPMGGSFAFSATGYSGTLAAGGGVTQDTRFDDSIKYVLDTLGPVRASAMYQFAGVGGYGNALQGDLGADFRGLSVDVIYSKIKDAITVSAYGAGANVSFNGVTLSPATPYPTGTLSGTVSDNTAYAAMAKYTYGPAKLFVGAEHLYYANPRSPVANGVEDLGGYIVSSVNNAAYNNNKVLTTLWAGVKYSILPNVDVTGAYYHVAQNSYNNDNGCSAQSVSSKCSGDLQAASVMVDYHITKRFDVYGGLMYSTVEGGYANGYLNTSTIDPMIGARFNF